MKFLVLAFAVTTAAVRAVAAETAAPLQLQPQSAIAPSKVAHANAPFVVPAPGPSLDLSASSAMRAQDRPRASCAEARDLCYDVSSGHLVYKPARQFMPDIPGLRPENISVRRDRIVFRYSF